MELIKTLPTERGYYYWDMSDWASHSKLYHIKYVYEFVDIGLATVIQLAGEPDERVTIKDMGGFWFGKVPDPDIPPANDTALGVLGDEGLAHKAIMECDEGCLQTGRSYINAYRRQAIARIKELRGDE